MAATMQIREFNGAGPTGTDKTSGTLRFKSADDATVDLVSPLMKPGAGAYLRSFKKSLRLYCVTKSTSTQITNIKAYTDGANGFGAGVTLWAKATSTAVYAQATVGIDGTGEGTTWADFFGYTSVSGLSLGAGPVTLTDATAVANFLELYVRVADNVAAPVTVPVEAIGFVWDEV